MNKAIAQIQSAKRILIVSHANPDGDAIGSTLALGVGLQQLGKQVVMYNQDPLPYSLQFLPHLSELVHQLPAAKDVDLTIMVDCSQPKRIGKEFEALAPDLHLMMIDHHLVNEAVGEHNYIDPTAAATGHVVYDVLLKMGARITPEIATLVYTTVVMDTGFFRHANTTADVFALSAELVRLGVNPAQVSQGILDSCPPAQLRLLPLVLETVEFHFGGLCASMVLTLQMLEEAGATPDMAEGFINYARSIAGVEVAVLFREREPNLFKISLRSRSRVNVADLSARFGGGGHKFAAGCTIEKPLPDVKSEVLAAIESVL